MITIKESMLIRKCINDYVLENKLDFDKSPLFMDLMTKLKEYEKPRFDNDLNLNIQRNNIDSQRKSLNKELKKYNFQTITNKKILELMQNERIESINKHKELIK
tara:strand:- start:654 stop:965 length:312 start_codon:yes stop_codon:yes gene_type:complete